MTPPEKPKPSETPDAKKGAEDVATETKTDTTATKTELEGTAKEKFTGFIDKFKNLDLSKLFDTFMAEISKVLKKMGLGDLFKSKKEDKTATAETPSTTTEEPAKKPAETTENKESVPVDPKKVLACGDSLATGFGRSYTLDNNGAQVGAQSNKLLKEVRAGLFKNAKENGCTSCVISIGANDLDPNLGNIQAIVAEARKYFPADKIVLCGVPEYTADPKYAGNWGKYGSRITQYNTDLEKNFPGIKIYRMPTNGLLHPHSYAGIVADLDKMLDVERKTA